MGFAVGNERLIAALTRVKSYLDYGAFTPIQVAATACAQRRRRTASQRCARLQARRDVMVDSSARPAGRFPRRPPRCSPGRRSPAFRHLGSLEFSKLLIEQADVAVAPGIGFGEHGDDYVRLALVENEHRIRQAARSIKKFLSRPRPNSPTTWCRLSARR
jgi:alanine-synthesizing transaminase